MPDSDGKLNAEDKDKIAKFLEGKGAVRPCDSCGQTAWTIGDHLLAANIHTPGGGLTIGGLTYPQVLLVCRNCFNTRSYMAVPMGIAGGGKKDV